MAIKCITPLCLISYPRIDKPTKGEEGKPDMYSAALVFTPELLALPGEKKLLDELQAISTQVLQEKFGDKLKNLLQSDNFKKGFRRDIAGKGYPEGSIYLNARSERKPGVVYGFADPATGRPAIVPDDKIRETLAPGHIVRASITPFAFNRPDNKGLSFALNNVQFVKVAPRLDGNAPADEEFQVDMSASPADLSDIGGE